MKLTISESKWHEIGKKAGWLKPIRRAMFTYENQNLKGELFNKPGFTYIVSLKYEQDIKDDSDFNKDTGYGKFEAPEGEKEIISFTVNEYNSGEPTMDEAIMLERDPGLLFKIEEYCLANAKEWIL